MDLIAQEKQLNYIYLPIHQIKYTEQLHTFIRDVKKDRVNISFVLGKTCTIRQKCANHSKT